VSVSIIILAQNEERDLPRLLESIRWCDDVHLVDSGSRDATVNIAKNAGVQCHDHLFSSFAAPSRIDPVVRRCSSR